MSHRARHFHHAVRPLRGNCPGPAEMPSFSTCGRNAKLKIPKPERWRSGSSHSSATGPRHFAATQTVEITFSERSGQSSGFRCCTVARRKPPPEPDFAPCLDFARSQAMSGHGRASPWAERRHGGVKWRSGKRSSCSCLRWRGRRLRAASSIRSPSDRRRWVSARRVPGAGGAAAPGIGRAPTARGR